MKVLSIYHDNENDKKRYMFDKYYFYGIPMISRDFGVKVDVECVDKCDYGEILSIDDLRNNKRSFKCNGVFKDVCKAISA